MTNKERALLAAEKAHANKTYDIYPYIYHVKQVVKIAEEAGYDESIIVACYLHDTLEDSDLSFNDIKKAFGIEVAEIVYAVTDELGRNRKERKAKTLPKIRANWKATVVKVCDRIANVTQSKMYNQKLYAMYQEENELFISSIKSDDHPSEVDRVWKQLDKLLSK